jgi:hypothetical protein
MNEVVETPNNDSWILEGNIVLTFISLGDFLMLNSQHQNSSVALRAAGDSIITRKLFVIT